MDCRYVHPELERQWRDEVLYLHSLWHNGPPSNPNPNPNPRPNARSNRILGPSTSYLASKKKKKERGKKKRNPQRSSRPLPDEPLPSNTPVSEIEWPCGPTPDRNQEPTGWADLVPPPSTAEPPSAEAQARAAALRVQQNGLRTCQDFFSKKDGSSSDEESEEDEDEMDEEESAAFSFFLGLFKEDENLRLYYEKNHEKGEFCCLVCCGIGEKKGKRFGDCVGLMQHSNSISKTKRRGAHRGFGRAVCRVLGWDINRLPSIVLDLGEPLGQSLAKDAILQDNNSQEPS